MTLHRWGGEAADCIQKEGGGGGAEGKTGERGREPALCLGRTVPLGEVVLLI